LNGSFGVEPGGLFRFERMPAMGAERKLMLEIGGFRFCPRLWENSVFQLAHRKSFSIFVNRRTNSAGDHDREKAVEKTILRNLSSCTFLHSLDPFLPFAGAS